MSQCPECGSEAKITPADRHDHDVDMPHLECSHCGQSGYLVDAKQDDINVPSKRAHVY